MFTNMSFVISGLGLISLLYAVYQFTRKRSTAAPPLFRDVCLKPADFEQDPVLSQAPKSEHPLPGRQIPQPPPSLLGDDYVFPEAFTKVD